jgi:hypothetical protein
MRVSRASIFFRLPAMSKIPFELVDLLPVLFE